jgi:hypothetical protein
MFILYSLHNALARDSSGVSLTLTHYVKSASSTLI